MLLTPLDDRFVVALLTAGTPLSVRDLVAADDDLVLPLRTGVWDVDVDVEVERGWEDDVLT